MKKRIILITIIGLLLLILPLMAGAEIVDSGTCGDDLTWRLDNDGILTIRGSGMMSDYPDLGSPWYGNRELITSVVFDGNITGIGDYTFQNCSNLSDVTIPDTVTYVGTGAFNNCYSITSLTLPYGINSIKPVLIAGCSSLSSISIPSSVTSIERYAFSGCTSLMTVTIPDSVMSIGQGAFQICSGLSSVTIPDHVTTIDSDAFQNCSSLTRIDIPASVTSFGTNVFTGCTSLETVTLPDHISTISSNSIPSTTQIVCSADGETATIISSLYNRAKIVSSDAPDFQWMCATEGTSKVVYITGYIGNADEVIIPSAIDGIPVSAVNNDSFKNNSNVLSIVIPDSVTWLGGSAFYGCSNLENVHIGTNVHDIWENAFYGCSSLVAIDIPESCIRVAEYVFAGCDSLKTIYIPDTVTILYDQAFYNCSGVEEIRLPSCLTVLPANMFTGCTNLKKVIYPENLTNLPKSSVPDGIIPVCRANSNSAKLFTNLGQSVKVQSPDSPDFLWYRANAESIYITGYMGESPEAIVPVNIDGLSVICIANNAFRNNDKITKVTLPDCIQWIGGYGFYNCVNLQEISIPGNVDAVWEYAFSNCIGLEKLTLCNGITRLSNYAFSNCISLREVIIPESLTDMASNAFNSCYNLTVYCGEKEKFFNYFKGKNGITGVLNGACGENLEWALTTDGLLTVSGTGNMCDFSRIQESNGNTKTDALWGRFDFNQVVVEEGVTSIGCNAFFGCDGIHNVSFPSTLTVIQNHAFYNCHGLTNLVFPDGLQTIGNASFYGCTCISNDVFIPDSVTYVGGSFCNWVVVYATLGSDGAKALCRGGGHRFIDPSRDASQYRYLYKNNKVVGLELYSCDKTITSFDVPDGVTSIGEYAFSGCTNLESVSLPDSVISIGDSAFYECNKLDSIIIPDSLNSVGSNVFYNTKVYATIDSEGAKAISKSGISFIGVGTPCKFRYCYTDGVESGFELTSCDTKATAVEIPYGVTSISDSAFWNCNTLTEVVIPNSVKILGSYAFSNCSNLYDVCIPDSVETIGNYAFSNCTRLSVVSVPDSVTSIGSHTFDDDCMIKTNTCTNVAFIWAMENNHLCETTKHEGIMVDAFVAPTCTETGLTEGSHCSACGAVLVPQEMIVANGHHIITDIEAKVPGCVTPGHTAASHCDVCNGIIESSETIPPTGHQPVTDHYIPATNSTTGLTEGSHCGVCGIILNDQKIIPVKSGVQETGEYEDGNGFIYSVSNCINTASYILYYDKVNRTNKTLNYAIFAQYADGSTDFALIRKTAGEVNDSSGYGDMVDGSLRVFQHSLCSDTDGTLATFGFTLSKPATVYVTLSGDGLSKRTQDVSFYTTYINYIGTWALKYKQSGSSVIDVSDNEQYKDYRIYLEQEGRAFYVDTEGPLEVEWQVIDNALNIFGLSFIPLENGDIAMPMGSELRNIYRKIDNNTVSGLQGRLGTWKAYLAIKEPEGVQVPISMLNDSVAKRVYLHADNTVYIPYGDGGPIQSGKITVNNNDIYIDGVRSDFSFNQYGQLIKHLTDDITLMYMHWGSNSAVPDVVKYSGPWYADSIIQAGYERIAKIAGLDDLLSLDATVYVDGRIVIHYCGKEESGTWTVENGHFETQGLSRSISFSVLGELLFDLGNDNYLCCTKVEPSGSEERLTLPSSLTHIEEEAFYGTKEKIVIIPNHCTKISARAFGNCPNLTFVYMPDSVTSISHDAFINSPCVVLICESDNTAAQFARQYNINYIIR